MTTPISDLLTETLQAQEAARLADVLAGIEQRLARVEIGGEVLP